MNDILPSAKIAGSQISVPVYSQISGVVNTWGDGHLSFGDVTGVVDAGFGLLGVALDPLKAISGAIAGWLMNILVDHVPPVKEAVDALLGDTASINKTAQTWYAAGEKFSALGERHLASISEVGTWQGPAADAYRNVVANTQGIYATAAGAANAVGLSITIAGVLVGMFRSMIWDAIKDALGQVIQAAITAVASSWFTLGGSLGVFAAWTAGKIGMLVAKISGWFAKLMRKMAALTKRWTKLSQAFEKAAKQLSKIAQNASKYARNQFTFGLPPGLNAQRTRDWWSNHPDLKAFKDAWDKGTKPFDNADKLINADYKNQNPEQS